MQPAKPCGAWPKDAVVRHTLSRQCPLQQAVGHPWERGHLARERITSASPCAPFHSRSIRLLSARDSGFTGDCPANFGGISIMALLMCKNHRPRRGQRPPRPPQMQRTRMPVPNRLLPRRRGVDRVERQGDFNELFAGRRHGSTFFRGVPQRISSISYFFSRNEIRAFQKRGHPH